jgi:hypothetical protein
MLVRATGDLRGGEMADHLREALEEAAFVEGERLEALKEEKHRQFAESPQRLPAHAGSAYPDERAELDEWMEEGMAGEGPGEAEDVVAVAAPHVSPQGGWASYRDAYRALSPAMKDRTFVVLGTSHYGQPESFGLSRKPFVTPYGATTPVPELTDYLAKRAPSAVRMEDYCHAFEHSIEFQVVFLQRLLGPGVRVLPILCGPFFHSLYRGGMPEDTDSVKAFLEALGELNAMHGSQLCWILGVDMAHMGARYQDEVAVRAHEGLMQEVEQRDLDRLRAITAGDAESFWSLVQPDHDDLKWCGSAPLYTFLRAVPNARGELRRYEQWNIDEESVVSFGALTFRSAA